MAFWNRKQTRSGEAPASTVNPPSWWLAGTYGGVTEVTGSTMALKIAAVYRCVDILSKGIAQLPLTIKRNQGGWYEQTTDDIFGLAYLLSVHPNPRLTAFEMMRNAVIQILLRGNAYIYPVEGADSYESLILLSPGSVAYDKFSDTYTVNDAVNRISGTFGSDRIIHLKNMSLDGGYTGVSTLTYAGKVLAISSNADALNVDTYKNGGTVKGFVSGKNGSTIGFGTVQDNQLKQVANDIENQLSSGKTIFNLPGEMSFNQISLSSSDMELLNTKEFNVLEICRFFGVHPDKVFAQQTSNYKASEMSQVAFLTDTLSPYLTQIEMEYQVKLIPREFYNDYRIDFDIEPMMQTDLGTQADYMTKTIAAGARTVNYWRKKLGQAPVEGGDAVLVSANLLELGSPKLRGGE